MKTNTHIKEILEVWKEYTRKILHSIPLKDHEKKKEMQNEADIVKKRVEEAGQKVKARKVSEKDDIATETIKFVRRKGKEWLWIICRKITKKTSE